MKNMELTNSWNLLLKMLKRYNYCDGISVSIGGVEHRIHGALLAFLADTLAAHYFSWWF